MQSITTNTLVMLGLFSIVYLSFILIKMAMRQLDLYDVIFLSMVAVLPSLFAYWPSMGSMLSKVAGVSAPYFILFGGLFFVIFLSVHRVTVKLHKLEKENFLIIQEISILRMKDNSHIQKSPCNLNDKESKKQI